MSRNLADLNTLYSEAETVDSDHFAEERSNILLVSGDHYSKNRARILSRSRYANKLPSEQRIRLTKNHIQKISKTYINNILSLAPTVRAEATNEDEIQDQKAAELHNAVIRDIETRHDLKARKREWCKDFFNVGECAVEILYDYDAGDFAGYGMDPETGEKRPSFGGDLVFKRVFGFNLLRCPTAQTFRDSPYIIVREMMPIKELRRIFEGRPDLQEKIQEDGHQSFMVFDGKSYIQTKNQVEVRRFYFRQSGEFPEGYYYIATSTGILFEGTLPMSYDGKKVLFPVEVATFDENETDPRGHSLIRQLRSCQVEVNRAASKLAEHQITLGDDKLIVQRGTTISHGGQLPGVRAIQVAGIEPKILPGRSGEQYLGYMSAQIDEMYDLANINEENRDKDSGTVDPYLLLFRTVRDKKKFSIYAEKFEDFLIRVYTLALEFKRVYCRDDELIPMVGSDEVVNIAEFRTASPLRYSVHFIPSSDDLESKMGKVLAVNHIVQYTSGKLTREDLGKVLTLYPYVNDKQLFEDLTLDYKNATNDILALDRGEYPATDPDDNHEYLIKRLTSRMKKASFKILSPEIQQNYMQKREEHRNFMTEKLREIRAAQADFIPTDGYFVVCDFYVQDPKDPAKKNRVKIPSKSIEWLLQRLQDQSYELAAIQDFSLEEQAQIAQGLNGGGSPISFAQPNMAPTGQIGVVA